MCVWGWTAGMEGVAAPSGSEQTGTQAKRLERRARGGESPVAGGSWSSGCRCVSTAGHEQPRGKLGRPRSKAKYTARPIVNEYREGKVKSPPARGVKEILKPSVYSQRKATGLVGRAPASWREGGCQGTGPIACLLKHEPASYTAWWA